MDAHTESEICYLLALVALWLGVCLHACVCVITCVCERSATKKHLWAIHVVGLLLPLLWDHSDQTTWPTTNQWQAQRHLGKAIYLSFCPALATAGRNHTVKTRPQCARLQPQISHHGLVYCKIWQAGIVPWRTTQGPRKTGATFKSGTFSNLQLEIKDRKF